MVENNETTMDDIRYIVGKGCTFATKPEGWVSVDLDKERNINGWGCALTILWQHGALKEVYPLSEDEWYEHEASQHCGISHIDLGLEVLH